MGAALGFFVAFDHVLHEDLGPLDRLLATPLAGKTLLDAFTNVYWKRARTMHGTTPGPLDWRRMRPRILRGECVTFGPSNNVRFRVDPPDERYIDMMVDTAPLALVPLPGRRPNKDRPGPHYRYDLSLGIGADLVAASDVDGLVDALVGFAQDVAAVVGVVIAAPTTYEANTVARHNGGDLGSALERRAAKLWVAQWQWGPQAREPEWGTFLTRAHAEAIGGVAAIRAAVAPFRIVESDGLVFVQLTPYAEALAPVTEEKRVRLEALMRPILTERLSRPAAEASQAS